MRIAVASDGLQVARCLRQCSSLTCYTVTRGVIVTCQNIPNPRLIAGKMQSFLKEMGVNVLITGSVTSNTASILSHGDIELVSGATGSARKAAEAYLTQTLTGSDGHISPKDTLPKPEIT